MGQIRFGIHLDMGYLGGSVSRLPRAVISTPFPEKYNLKRCNWIDSEVLLSENVRGKSLILFCGRWGIVEIWMSTQPRMKCPIHQGGGAPNFHFSSTLGFWRKVEAAKGPRSCGQSHPEMW